MSIKKVAAKPVFIPKTRVESWRRSLYEKAHAARLKLNPELTWSDWIREALDEKAQQDLAEAKGARPR